jgi:Tetratricopeptide repeat
MKRSGATMTTLAAISQPTQATTVVKWTAQVLGAILAVTTWHAVRMLTDLPRYWGTQSYWLTTGVYLSVWLPCWVGGVALLRGRTSGYLPLYLAILFCLTNEVLVVFPFPHWLRGPSHHLGEWYRLLVMVTILGILCGVHRLSIRCATTPGRLRRLWLVGPCLLLLLGALRFGCLHGLVKVDEAGAEHVQQGVALYEAGQQAEAVAEWNRAIDRYPYTSAWGMALFNTGLYYQKQERYHEAIRHFEILLASGLDDRDPTRYLMEAYQNYHHRACLEISACYEGLDDFPSALKYAFLARDVHPYQSWCATCRWSIRAALDARIARLERGENAEEEQPIPPGE